jgi:hypothetical protein
MLTRTGASPSVSVRRWRAREREPISLADGGCASPCMWSGWECLPWIFAEPCDLRLGKGPVACNVCYRPRRFRTALVTVEVSTRSMQRHPGQASRGPGRKARPCEQAPGSTMAIPLPAYVPPSGPHGP